MLGSVLLPHSTSVSRYSDKQFARGDSFLFFLKSCLKILHTFEQDDLNSYSPANDINYVAAVTSISSHSHRAEP